MPDLHAAIADAGANACVGQGTRKVAGESFARVVRLTDYLVPYFKIGLEHDEYCLWVTSDPLTIEDAQARLRAAVADIGSRAQRGQIEFVDYRTWYLEDGRLDADRALAGWAEREQCALTIVGAEAILEKPLTSAGLLDALRAIC